MLASSWWLNGLLYLTLEVCPVVLILIVLHVKEKTKRNKLECHLPAAADASPVYGHGHGGYDTAYQSLPVGIQTVDASTT